MNKITLLSIFACMGCCTQRPDAQCIDGSTYSNYEIVCAELGFVYFGSDTVSTCIAFDLVKNQYICIKNAWYINND